MLLNSTALDETFTVYELELEQNQLWPNSPSKTETEKRKMKKTGEDEEEQGVMSCP